MVRLFHFVSGNLLLVTATGAVAFVLLLVLINSIRSIGPTEVGLVRKRFAVKKLGSATPWLSMARRVTRPG